MRAATTTGRATERAAMLYGLEGWGEVMVAGEALPQRWGEGERDSGRERGQTIVLAASGGLLLGRGIWGWGWWASACSRSSASSWLRTGFEPAAEFAKKGQWGQTLTCDNLPPRRDANHVSSAGGRGQTMTLSGVLVSLLRDRCALEPHREAMGSSSDM